MLAHISILKARGPGKTCSPRSTEAKVLGLCSILAFCSLSLCLSMFFKFPDCVRCRRHRNAKMHSRERGEGFHGRRPSGSMRGSHGLTAESYILQAVLQECCSTDQVSHTSTRCSPSLQATRAGTRLTVDRAHASPHKSEVSAFLRCIMQTC